MKKHLLWLLCIVLLTTIVALVACDGDDVEPDTQGVVYTLSDDGQGYCVSDGDEASGDIEILSNYKGLPVVGINDVVFSDNSALTSVTIPSSVTLIGAFAFNECNNLKTVKFENGSKLKSIGAYAFSKCSNLTTITIPSEVTSIGNGSFDNCSSLTTINVPNSVTDIGNDSFYNCKNLQTVVLERNSKLQNIGNSAFNHCDSLTNFKFPSSVTKIGEMAFGSCNLQTATFGKDSKLESLGLGAFWYCKNLTSVTIPNNIKSIGKNAFYGCDSLKYTKSDGASYLGNEENNYLALVRQSTFSSSCTIANTTKIICSGAFSDCTRITSITIPSSVTSIGKWAFSGCTGLNSVVFENPNGWKAGDTNLTCTNPSTNAKNLGDLFYYNYSDYDWTRS